MTFDLFTLIAQLINFAILLVLLRVFLYRPVLDAMDQRARLTAAALAEARQLQSAAEADRAGLVAERAAIEGERAAALTALSHEVERLRGERMAAVEVEAADSRRAASAALERELDAIAGRLRDNLSELVLSELRAMLAWLADDDLERRALVSFAERLRALSAERVAELRAAASAARPERAAEQGGSDEAPGVVLVTSQGLDEETASEFTDLVTRLTGAERVSFEVDPRLLAGAALHVGGLRVDGSAAARLDALEVEFIKALAGLRSAASTEESLP